MTNLIGKGIVAALTVMGTQLLACGAPPDSRSEAEATGTASQAKVIVPICPVGSTWTAGGGCGTIFRFPVPIPDNPITATPPRGTPQLWGSSSQATLRPIDPVATDALDVAERQLYALGCSQPIYWQAWYPFQVIPGTDANGSAGTYGWIDLPAPAGTFVDEANAIAMLCPAFSNDVATVVSQLGTTPLPYPPGADTGPHVSTTFTDYAIPAPAFGQEWVVLWEDPYCNSMTGCMISDSDAM